MNMKRRLCFFCLILMGLPTYAFNWHDLWSTPDQQAQLHMQKGEFAKAQDLFEHNEWAAAASYKAGNYKKAASRFERSSSEQGYYNHGNALAHLGQYQQAIAAYDKALKLNAKNKDALFNRQLVEQLLKKQQQNKQQDSKQQQAQNQEIKPKQKSKAQQKDQKKQQDQQQQQQQQQGDNQKDKTKKEQAKPKQSTTDREKQQAKQQWLKLIPDDPGGLMREKFLRDHLRRQQGWYQ